MLFATIVLGILWEFVYHALMQFRWEKDWPTMFGFLTIINEGALLWFLIKANVVPWVPKDLPVRDFRDRLRHRLDADLPVRERPDAGAVRVLASPRRPARLTRSARELDVFAAHGERITVTDWDGFQAQVHPGNGIIARTAGGRLGAAAAHR